MKHIILSIVLLFSFTGCSLKTVSVAPKVEPKEILVEKQVLVYDKTISLPKSYPIGHLQFSPTNPDELAIAVPYSRQDMSYSLHYSIHYALIDLKNSRVKKEIKFAKDKDVYSQKFNYSDDEKNLYIYRVAEMGPQKRCQNIITLNYTGKPTYEKKCRVVTGIISNNKFTILDLNTGKLSPYYEYNCNHLIPKESQNNYKIKRNNCYERASYPIRKADIQDLDENTLMTAGYRYTERAADSNEMKAIKEGIVLYDKDSLKAKEIIPFENSYFMALSLDKQYVLFKEILNYQSYFDRVEGEVEEVMSYKVYDLKNRKTIHNLGNLTSTGSHESPVFLSKNKIAIFYETKNYKKSISNGKFYISVIDLITKEKKTVKSDYVELLALNSRYIILTKDVYVGQIRLIDIFDTKEMKIVQQFTFKEIIDTHIIVSQKHKKVAFSLNHKIYLYNIVEEGE